ncbi:degenerin unc-8-like [Mizuhopecten yessoensis]|nr:degenerin unc-8-like [Mizuhopecten yessoensis]
MAILYATQQTLGVNLMEFDKAGETTVITDEVKNASASYKVRNLREARDLFLRTLSNVRSEYNSLHPDKDNNPYTYSINDVVLRCTFQGSDCGDNPSLSQNIQDDELYGTCFEIKAENVPVLTAGQEQGIELMISLDHEEFIPFITEGIGINTRIYDNKNKNPFLAESSDGVKLSAGFEINIAISLTEYNRKPGNNARCDNTNQFPNILACLEECVRNVVSEKCGCGSTGAIDEDFEPCDKSASLVCRKRIQQSIYSHCPDCKQPCNEKKYEQLITMTRWPSKSTEPLVRKILRDNNKTTPSLSENVMLVHVYYSSLTVQSFNEEVAYTEENFVSDIGGQLGLWIGMSVLTLAEIVELGILILIGFCETRNKDVTPVVPTG